MTPELVLRPFIWNERRYDRVYNNNLTTNLLYEEFNEWIESTTDVDLLDALMDIQFVALGGIWKLNMTAEQMEEAQDNALHLALQVLNISGVQPGFVIQALIVDMMTAQANDLATNLFTIQFLCEAQAKVMGLSPEQVDKAFEIVCDSNDSKTIAKTDPNVKANIDKGDYFVAPEPRLQEVLNGRHH